MTTPTPRTDIHASGEHGETWEDVDRRSQSPPATPTPETDGQYKEYARRDNNVKCVDIDFARKLERERDELQQHLTAASDTIAQLQGQIQTLADQRMELLSERDAWKAKAERTCRWDCKLSPTTGVAGHSTECGSQYIYDPGAVWCKLCGGRIVRHL